MAGTALDRAGGEIDASLVDEINRHHADVERHARRTLESAVECGRLLTAAKGRLPHGEWLPWLADNFDGSERIAQMYMRLHDHRDEVLSSRDGNPQRVADISLRAALRDLTTPREQPPDAEHVNRLFPGLKADPAAGDEPEPPDSPAASTAPAQPPPGETASATARPDPVPTVDAEVMLDPPAILDSGQQRQWDRADDALLDVRQLMIESAGPNLAPMSVAGALRDASHKARALAGYLEGLAGGIETRERRRPAA